MGMNNVTKLNVNGTKLRAIKTDRRGDFRYYTEVVVNAEGKLELGREFRIHRSEYRKPMGSGFTAEFLG